MFIWPLGEGNTQGMPLIEQFHLETGMGMKGLDHLCRR